MRLIDADKLANRLEANLKRWQDSAAEYKEDRAGVTATREAIRDVKVTSTIDAVPVVRCEECKHRADLSYMTYTVFCCKFDSNMRKIDFCSYGERKDD